MNTLVLLNTIGGFIVFKFLMIRTLCFFFEGQLNQNRFVSYDSQFMSLFEISCSRDLLILAGAELETNCG